MRFLYLLIVLIIPFTGCRSNSYENSQETAHDTIANDTLIPTHVIRRPTIFDTKDTNSRVGQCYKKINENIEFFVEVEPKEYFDGWYLPFDLKDRFDIKLIKVISPFGAGRTSHLRGHKHSGVDMVPVNKDTGIYIYPLAKGIVCFKKVKDPFSSITIKHKMNDSTYMYTSYIHLKEIYVENGDNVDPNIKIGKIFTKKEVRRFRGPYDHLHLEIRKNFDDFGFASGHCMNKDDLNEFFYEPIEFLTKNLKQK